MGKGLIGFCHPVSVFLLLESAALALACGENFACQLVGHTFPVSFPAEPDKPLNTQGNLTVGAYFGGDLKSGPSDTTAPHFNCRCDIIERPSPDFVSVLIGRF